MNLLFFHPFHSLFYLNKWLEIVLFLLSIAFYCFFFFLAFSVKNRISFPVWKSGCSLYVLSFSQKIHMPSFPSKAYTSVFFCSCIQLSLKQNQKKKIQNVKIFRQGLKNIRLELAIAIRRINRIIESFMSEKTSKVI